MLGHFSLLPNDGPCHSLLEPQSPAYTTITVRRAFIVWLHCGQQNEFRDVCNYFHYLESMEDKLSAKDRATSRLHEYSLLSTLPPSSQYLSKHFPKLYRHNKTSKVNVKEIQELTLEDSVFNLEGFHDLKIQKGATTKDIIKTSQMIRKYCKTHSKSLRVLLAEFQDFAKKTEATNSVDNIAMYIKKKYLKDELVTWTNIPRSFSFLDNLENINSSNVSGSAKHVLRENKSPTLTIDHKLNANKNANKIKILINESRRKELLNMIPKCQNVLSAKLSEAQKPKPGSVFYDYVRKM